MFPITHKAMSKGSDGSETWNLTKQQTLKLKNMQGARERNMINITWRDLKTKVQDIMEMISKLKMELGWSCG